MKILNKIALWLMVDWLGTMNYGIITANKMDKWLYAATKAD